MFRRTLHLTELDSTLRSMAWLTLVLILFAWDTTPVKADGILVTEVMESWALSSDLTLIPISVRRPPPAEKTECSVRRDDQQILSKTRRIPTPDAIDIILDNQGFRTIAGGTPPGSRASTTRSRNIRGESVLPFALICQQPPVVGHLYPAPSIQYSPPVPFELLRPPRTSA